MTTERTIAAEDLRPVEIAPFPALTVSLRATLPTVVEHAMPADEALRAEAARLGLDPETPTQWIYTGINGDPANEFQLDIALPVPAPLGEPAVGFHYETLPAYRCVEYTFTGPWSDFGAVYDVLFPKLHEAGYRHNHRIREVYRVVDLEHPEQCVTDFQIGVGE
jgi:DNA gyrase inhibitor GyrI